MPLKFPFVSFFLFNLLCSTLFTISSYSWLGAWTGLEFNLISFVPLLMANATPSSTESAVKYFIIQAFSSALLLLSFLLSTLIILNPPLSWIILASLMLKVGIAPLHHWVPNIATSLSWLNLFILLSWQKLAPLALMSHFLSNPMNSKLLMVFSSISALVGGLGGMNQTQVRVILAFSSIGHMGWTLACVLMSTPNTLVYLLMYVLNLMPLMFTLNYLNAMSSSTSFLLSSAPPFLALTTLLLFFSLGGMPPLLGFMPKLMVLNMLTSMSQYYLAASLILGSLMNLYYYLTFTLTFTFSPSSSPKMSSCSPSLTFYTITFMPLMALPPALSLL